MRPWCNPCTSENCTSWHTGRHCSRRRLKGAKGKRKIRAADDHYHVRTPPPPLPPAHSRPASEMAAVPVRADRVERPGRAAGFAQALAGGPWAIFSGAEHWQPAAGTRTRPTGVWARAQLTGPGCAGRVLDWRPAPARTGDRCWGFRRRPDGPGRSGLGDPARIAVRPLAALPSSAEHGGAKGRRCCSRLGSGWIGGAGAHD
jgi:hypothetical protein